LDCIFFILGVPWITSILQQSDSRYASTCCPHVSLSFRCGALFNASYAEMIKLSSVVRRPSVRNSYLEFLPTVRRLSVRNSYLEFLPSGTFFPREK
jgi:hypothetical protein